MADMEFECDAKTVLLTYALDYTMNNADNPLQGATVDNYTVLPDKHGLPETENIIERIIEEEIRDKLMEKSLPDARRVTCTEEWNKLWQKGYRDGDFVLNIFKNCNYVIYYYNGEYYRTDESDKKLNLPD